ncbi:MAG: hypothetical protein GWP07_06745 [Xanthomonadaceae bacterium]|nr:hypothetical protein [Xanthomonadaceae bacterium]
MSDTTPLLSHLTILENIALLNEFHHGKKKDKAEKEAQQLLADCGFEHIGSKRPFEINNKESFVAKFLRAVVSDFEKILIVRPFDQADSFEIMNLLQDLSAFFPHKSVEVIATEANKRYYEGQHVLQ